MKISIETENCTYSNHYIIEESANSKIRIKLELPIIVSIQSKKKVIEDLKSLIHSELNKFEWIITGSVIVEFIWYLNAVERQETDKIGDIDNISKPIQDALVGPNSILIDDSQIGGLYTYWQSRNDITVDNIIYIDIKFNNDTVHIKKNLLFIQYTKAVCLPININFENITEIITAKIIIKMRLKSRNLAMKAKKSGFNIDNYFVCSEYDFHRTRLNAFPPDQILSIDQLNKKCIDSGITFNIIRDFYKNLK